MDKINTQAIEGAKDPVGRLYYFFHTVFESFQEKKNFFEFRNIFHIVKYDSFVFNYCFSTLATLMNVEMYVSIYTLNSWKLPCGRN